MSPVKSYYDSPMALGTPSTPVVDGRTFVDWEPGMMVVPDFPLPAQEIDFEAELANSPLARRFASPKGGLLLGPGDAVPEETVSDEPIETDMSRLIEEYAQVMSAAQETQEEPETK